MAQRSKDTYDIQVYDFIKDIAVVCPVCKRKAFIDTNGGLFQNPGHTKIVCPQCGYNKKYSDLPDAANRGNVRRVHYIGGHIDPYFHEVLWLNLKCGENVLWAYNEAHLEILEQHVSAKLRERNLQNMRNNSIGSRLPKWMTAAKNREMVLKGIAQLRIRNTEL